MPLDDVARAVGLAWMAAAPIALLVLAVATLSRRIRHRRTPAAARPTQGGRHRAPAQEHHQ